jgi:hypothetical protein
VPRPPDCATTPRLVSPQPTEPPTVGVLLAGAVGVLLVVGFVAAVVLGGEAQARPGDRVALVEVDAHLVVLAGRCEDERVTAVELRVPNGPTLWRIASSKGSITQRYEAGGEPPFNFQVVAPLQPLPLGDLEAIVEVDHTLVDSEVFPQPAPQSGEVAAPCGRSQQLGGVALLFVAGAVMVVTAYIAMARRWFADRGRRR